MLTKNIVVYYFVFVFSVFPVKIIVANNGWFDFTCRPVRYQIFCNGCYLGTISPKVMYARNDGSFFGDDMLDENAIFTFTFEEDGTFKVHFARYGSNGPVCCPSRMSTVTYHIEGGSSPRLVPIAVSTRR
ncbi:MAG TPA: LppP/LprE family lipoprotein [Thermosynechococcus sp. M55_K2018_012]|nr:LppP/LprE family lipoprotein [Thermosynechococcus sp. M55_K2018_012]